MSLRQRKKIQPEAAAAAAIDTRGGDDVAVAPSSAADSKNSKGGGGSALTRLRETIFPIYGKEEVTKFLLMGSIKFFIILALTLTRDTKDTLVVTQCGAEAIAFLKVRTDVHSLCAKCKHFMHNTHTPILSHKINIFPFWCIDLRCVASCNCLYCSLFKNGIHHGQTDSLLYNMHPILCVFSSL
jgi:hypothetical protein